MRFLPSLINRQWELYDMEVIKLLSEADRELGKPDLFSQYVPNIDLFISTHVAKAVTKSSKIEGTQTNIDEALLEKEDIPLEKRNDWEEVQNYIQALERAVVLLQDLPFSSRLIRALAYRILMAKGAIRLLQRPANNLL